LRGSAGAYSVLQSRANLEMTAGFVGTDGRQRGKA
jgi:hypothetical protein